MIAPCGKCWIEPTSPLYKLKPGDKVWNAQTGCFMYHQEEPFLVDENMKSCFYRDKPIPSKKTFPLWYQRSDKSIQHFTNTIEVPPGESVPIASPILPGGELAVRVGLEALSVDAVFLTDIKPISATAVTDGTAPRPSDNLLLCGEKEFFAFNCGNTTLKLAYSAYCS